MKLLNNNIFRNMEFIKFLTILKNLYFDCFFKNLVYFYFKKVFLIFLSYKKKKFLYFEVF